MAGNERGKAPLITSVAPPPPPPRPTPKPPPAPLRPKHLPPPPLGHRQPEAPGRLLLLLHPPPAQILGKPPRLAGKARVRRRGRALPQPPSPPWQRLPPPLLPRHRPCHPSPLLPPPALRASLPWPPGRMPGWWQPPPVPAASSSRPPTASATINSGRGPFPTMTRKHGVCCLLVPTSPHVETYVQALARVVGPTAIVAASKMYGKVVFFLASEAAAQETVEKGLAVGGGVCPPGAARRPGRPPSPDLRLSFFTQCRPLTRSLHPGETHFCHQPSPIGLQGPHPPSRPFIPPASAASTAAAGA
ncbi:unnamed protein product [Eretmochelys imbricata]